MIIARRLVIHGQVQGVGYRESMIDTAHACEVAGWVRNRVDGTVEAWVQGEPAPVERVIAWCRRGPRTARVSAVEVTEQTPASDIATFTRRRTE
jgi:acylphosphatase